MKLRCLNPECESNTGNDSPLFTVNMTVDEDGDACESARKIDGMYFTCCYCQSNAEWIKEEKRTEQKQWTDERIEGFLRLRKDRRYRKGFLQALVSAGTITGEQWRKYTDRIGESFKGD